MKTIAEIISYGGMIIGIIALLGSVVLSAYYAFTLLGTLSGVIFVVLIIAVVVYSFLSYNSNSDTFVIDLIASILFIFTCIFVPIYLAVKFKIWLSLMLLVIAVIGFVIFLILAFKFDF